MVYCVSDSLCFALTRRIEGVVAVVPRQARLPRGEHVVERPGHQHWIEDAVYDGYRDHSYADSCGNTAAQPASLGLAVPVEAPCEH